MTTDAAWIEHLMGLALVEAELAYNQGEVPVGAVVANLESRNILGAAHNQMEHLKDATAHAEVLAMRQAFRQQSDWRLENCVLCVTLEPCTMCAGAISLARLPLIVFGASDQRLGAYGSLYDLSWNSSGQPNTRVVRGVLEQQSKKLLQQFFKERRSGEMAEWLKALDSKSSIGE